MSGVGVKGDLVLNVTTWPLFTISTKIRPAFTDIHRTSVKIWAPWALLRPPGPGCLGENDQAKVNLGPKGFQMSRTNLVPLGLLVPTVFKIRSETCRTVAQFFQNLYMIKKESLPDRPKFCRSGSAVRHLFWRLFQWPKRKHVSCESTNFLLNRRKHEFWNILVLFGIVGPVSLIKRQVSCLNPVGFNLLQNIWKTDLWPNFVTIWGQKGHKYSPWGPRFNTLLKVGPVSLN